MTTDQRECVPYTPCSGPTIGVSTGNAATLT